MKRRRSKKRIFIVITLLILVTLVLLFVKIPLKRERAQEQERTCDGYYSGVYCEIYEANLAEHVSHYPLQRCCHIYMCRHEIEYGELCENKGNCYEADIEFVAKIAASTATAYELTTEETELVIYTMRTKWLEQGQAKPIARMLKTASEYRQNDTGEAKLIMEKGLAQAIFGADGYNPLEKYSFNAEINTFASKSYLETLLQQGKKENKDFLLTEHLVFYHQ